ncbi:MAG: hypothetical protein QOG23_2064 [Blastocatellia bacterium]|nr:hypothetical protein [Blastocatellia bacterium]
MSLSSQPIRDDQAAEVWNQVCRTSRTATFFHTKVWADVLKTSFPRWSSRPIALEYSDGNSVVLPLMRRHGFGSVEYYCESMLPGVYGGPVFMHAATEKHWSALWDAVNEFSNIVVLGNPFLPAFGFPVSTHHTISTHVLDLKPGINRILKDFRKGHRADLKVARKRGVEIRIASSSQEVDSYFDVYQNTLARWGKKASGFYPRTLFHNLFLSPEYGRSVKLWLALHENKVIAGGWLFYHNEHAVYWHGAMHSDYMSSHPVHLLVTEAIEDSYKEGFRWFDFNPSGGLEGVEHFKRGFGAIPLEFSSYRRLGPLGKAFRLSRHLRQSVLRTCAL